LTDADIIEILGTYPDKVADALEKWKRATLERKRVGSKLYLELKAKSAGGEKITVKELEMMVESNQTHYELCLEEIMAESDHMKLYEKLMAAKKMASIRAGF
jgi:hypothetical protein